VANPTDPAATTIAIALETTTLDRGIGFASSRPMVRRASSPARARAAITTVTAITAIGAVIENVSTWKKPSAVLMSPCPTNASSVSGRRPAKLRNVTSIRRYIGPSSTPITRNIT
jgi:hypothetical protein